MKGLVIVFASIMIFWGRFTLIAEPVPKDVIESFVVAPHEIVSFSVRDEGLVGLIREMTSRSKYVPAGDFKELFLRLGVDLLFLEESQIDISGNMITVSGSRYFCSECMKVISKIFLIKNIDPEDFGVIGAGYASGDVERLNDLLERMGFKGNVSD